MVSHYSSRFRRLKLQPLDSVVQQGGKPLPVNRPVLGVAERTFEVVAGGHRVFRTGRIGVVGGAGRAWVFKRIAVVNRGEAAVRLIQDRVNVC